MKLSTAQRQQALEQLSEQPEFEETVLVSDSNPALPKLNDVFGEHTFFLADDGLHIIEPAQSDASADSTGRVVKVASWSTPDRTALTPHRPEPTNVVVMLTAA